MNHAEETKELLFNDQGLNEAQHPKAEPQLRRDGKLMSKRPLKKLHKNLPSTKDIPDSMLVAGVSKRKKTGLLSPGADREQEHCQVGLKDEDTAGWKVL